MTISLLENPHSFSDDVVGWLAKSADGLAYDVLVSTYWLDDHIVDTPIESESEEQKKRRYFAAATQNRELLEVIAKAKFARSEFQGRKISVNPGDEP